MYVQISFTIETDTDEGLCFLVPDVSNDEETKCEYEDNLINLLGRKEYYITIANKGLNIGSNSKPPERYILSW